MNIRELQQNWDELGASDPLWAVITDPQKKDNQWLEAEFLQTGIDEIATLWEQLESLKHPIPNGKALDFGCGVGRVTQALAAHFETTYGVDIAPSMLEKAKSLNRYPDTCNYLLNTTPDLQCFEANTFDFVYSVIALQHMRPDYARLYLQEFIRVLQPGGLLVFQVPAAMSNAVIYSLKRQAKRWVRKASRLGLTGPKTKARFNVLMEMHCIKKDEVVAHLEQAGGSVLHIAPDDSPGPGWTSYLYFVTKPTQP